ncbi:MAG: hypothetical protein RR824_02725 [Clostridia bacterium]
MQVVKLKPQRIQLLTQLLGLALCVFGMLLAPVLCLPLSLLLPLFACPLVGHKQQWAGFLSVAAPAVISLLSGFDVLYSLSLLLPCGLCLAVAEYLRPSKKAALPYAFVYYIIAYFITMGMIIACLAQAVGGSLVLGLAAKATEAIRTSPKSGQILYNLASMGIVGLPSNYVHPTMLSFTLDPIFIHQLLLSLQRSLELALWPLIPSWFVQICFLGGLFTTLRTQHMNHAILLVTTLDKPSPDAKKVEITLPSGFSRLQLPPSLRLPLSLIALASLFCALTPGDLWGELSLLLWAVVLCLFEVLGAAVLVGVLSARKPEQKSLWGCLAAALYLLFPIALFLIGMLDPFLHFRSRTLFQEEQQEEE